MSAPDETFRGFCRIGAAVFVALAMTVLSVGCGLGPARAVAGARAYAEGTAALDSGDQAFAIRRLERAAELVPHGSEIQNHLGLAYWSSGQPETAREAFERAIELDCDNAAARANLTRLDAEASVAVERAVTGGPTDGER